MTYNNFSTISNRALHHQDEIMPKFVKICKARGRERERRIKLKRKRFWTELFFLYIFNCEQQQQNSCRVLFPVRNFAPKPEINEFIIKFQFFLFFHILLLDSSNSGNIKIIYIVKFLFLFFLPLYVHSMKCAELNMMAMHECLCV